MKKVLVTIIVLAIALVSLGTFVSCKKAQKYEIALITDKGDIDDMSFNQGAWEGVAAYVKDKDISNKYYKPEDVSDEAYLATIDLAVAGGAKVVVTPGFLFEPAVYNAQTKYPDVKFILLDGAPHTADYATFKTEKNVASIMYAEEESGFLAGYAAVKDGYTKLGFMGGMAVPAVQAFGYGYLNGIDYAANEMGITENIQVTYHYTGDFAETPANKTTAATMYTAGTEIIFACGGSAGKSVMSAAAEAGKKVIGVDVDQRYDSTTVITSATKGLGASVQAVLKSIYDDKDFDTKYGGKTTYFDVQNAGIGLPTEVIGNTNGDAFDRFITFDKAAYDTIFATLKAGEIELSRTITIAATTGEPTISEIVTGLGLTKVTVSLVATPQAVS